jgi:cytochrome P450
MSWSIWKSLSKAVGCENPREFRYERWFEHLPNGVLEFADYRHLTSFLDGPKVYVPGRSFAVTNMKVILSVLRRRYTFELPVGPETRIKAKRMFVHRSVVDGQKGLAMSMRVIKAE